MTENPPCVFNFERPPILLIGAGISKRYLNDYKTWEQLLQSIAERIGIKKRVFDSYVADATEKCDQYGVLPYVAAEIKEVFISKIKDETINIDDFYSEEELKLYDEHVDPFKIIVASEVKEYVINESSQELIDEVKEFRSLINIVPAIITTNYDCFLEKSIFKEFKVFSNISDYYFSDSQGIGEIYKIHGSSDDPNTIIISNKDYKKYEENSKIISAKILSMLCEYPLLIMGYRLDDADVKKIICDLIGSLDEDKLKMIEKNIIYISHKKDEMGFIKTNTSFEYDGKRMTFTTYETDNFIEIYKQLHHFTPSTTPTKIRKLRQLVKKIVISSNPTDEQLITIGKVDLDSDSHAKVVLILTDEEHSKLIKSYEIIDAEVLVKDILVDGIKLDPDNVVDYFNKNKRWQHNEYLPLYPYLRKTTIKSERYSSTLNKFLKYKETQLVTMLDKSEKLLSSYDLNDSEQLSKIKIYLKPLSVVLRFNKKIIDYDTAILELSTLLTEYNKNNRNFDTNFKFAVTYITKNQ